jgi:hypothetical protein
MSVDRTKGIESIPYSPEDGNSADDNDGEIVVDEGVNSLHGAPLTDRNSG